MIMRMIIITTASASGSADAAGKTTRGTSFEFAGVSSEWKYKLRDPVADAFGFALYGEVTASTTEQEFEAKLIFDQQVGNVLLAANVVGELELDMSKPGATEVEQMLELDLGAAYRLSSRCTLGLELRNQSRFEEGKLEHSALYAGPVVAYTSHAWWVALSATPQLPALYKSADFGGGHGRVFDLVTAATSVRPGAAALTPS